MRPIRAPERSPLRWAAALLALAWLVPAPALAQEGEQPPAEGEASDEVDESKAKYFAVLGGDVHTGTGAVLRGATVLARDGVIVAIGHDLYLPEGTEKLDATGYRVYPGLVAISASTRITQGGGFDVEDPEALDQCCVEFADPNHVHPETPWTGDEGELPPQDAGGATDAEAAADEEGGDESTLGDSYDPFSPNLIMTLGVGITTAEQSNSAFKLKRGEIGGVVMREKFLSTFPWSSASSGKTALRDKFAKAAGYLRDYRAWEEKKTKDKEAKEPAKRGIDSKALAVLRGDARAKFNANEREDLIGIARLAQEFGFRPVIEGCAEGWTVAEELGRAGAAAIVVPRMRRDKSEELLRPGGSSIENAALLHSHGVQVAVAPANPSIDLGGITGRDLLSLTTDAAFAVRGGLSENAALASITIVPARMLGVEHRVGTLEVGKDCDLLVANGDILHYQTMVEWTVVAGKIAYDRDKELFFAHIRPRPKADPAEEETPAPEAAPEAPEKTDGPEKPDKPNETEKPDETEKPE